MSCSFTSSLNNVPGGGEAAAAAAVPNSISTQSFEPLHELTRPSHDDEEEDEEEMISRNSLAFVNQMLHSR